jgi:multidrug resistance protein, MATE family
MRSVFASPRNCRRCLSIRFPFHFRVFEGFTQWRQWARTRPSPSGPDMSTLDEPATAALDGAPPPAATWRAELRELFVLAWPLVLAQLAQNALFTTDVIFIGILGPQYLAAGILANSLFFAIQLLAIGIVGAVAPLVAQAIGGRNVRAVRHIVQAGLWVGFAAALVILPIIWNAGAIMIALGQSETNALLAEDFLRYAVWTVFPAFAIIAIRSFLAAHGATRVILLITLAGVLVNILGNYLFMLGNWGFPRMELKGSGLSTTLVNVLMLALMLAYVQGHRRFRRYHIFARLWRIDWARISELVTIGGPIGLSILAEAILFTSAAFLMGWLGTNEVAAHAVAMQAVSLAFMVPLGLSQATTVRVGLAYGRRSPEGIRRAGWASFWLTIVFMSAAAALFLTIPHTVMGLFLDPTQSANQTAIALGASYLVIAGLFELADGTQVTMQGVLRGLSDTRWPMIIALVGYWIVGMPVAYICGFVLGWRGIGIWTGLAFGLAAVAVVLVARFAMRERLGLLKWPSP